MRIDILTLFPEMYEGVFGSSMVSKARKNGYVSINTIDFRNYADDKHQKVDDYPYGGGGGMVLKPQPIFAAVEDLLLKASTEIAQKKQRKEKLQISPPKVILMCPQGECFTQRKAEELAQQSHLIFICGHYEGYDERIREHLVTDELSIGDYVLTGGELPAMVVIDAVVRLLPGVLGNKMSVVTDSFFIGLLEHPHYTRPVQFRNWKVPNVLISGHHANIEAWRREQALKRTFERRPDLLERSEELSKEDKRILERLKDEAERDAMNNKK